MNIFGLHVSRYIVVAVMMVLSIILFWLGCKLFFRIVDYAEAKRKERKEMGTCDGCKYLDWVNKKWWGCTTKVCTYKSKMGKALPQHTPSLCPIRQEVIAESDFNQDKSKEFNEMLSKRWNEMLSQQSPKSLNTAQNCANIAKEMRVCDIFDAIRSKADEHGRITIVDHFKISGVNLFAEDLISFIEYAINTTGDKNEV